MSNNNKIQEIVYYWWSQANQSLAAAQREFEAEDYHFTINRLYYAAFYAVSAVLIERNYTFKKHATVRALFHREFIKTGLLDVTWGKLYDKLFEDRQMGDYLALASFDPQVIETQITDCRQFLNELRPLISSLS